MTSCFDLLFRLQMAQQPIHHLPNPNVTSNHDLPKRRGIQSFESSYGYLYQCEWYEFSTCSSHGPAPRITRNTITHTSLRSFPRLSWCRTPSLLRMHQICRHRTRRCHRFTHRRRVPAHHFTVRETRAPCTFKLILKRGGSVAVKTKPKSLNSTRSLCALG